MTEIWKDIAGFDGLYQVSNLGRIKSLPRISKQNHRIGERILKTYVVQGGYLDVNLYIDGTRYHRKVHRLVAEAFVPNPDSLPEVDHIDTDKTNNAASNLRWVTHSENHLNPLTVALRSRMLTGRKLPPEQVFKMRKRIAVYHGDECVHVFDSYADMDANSKSIFGVTLWGVYVRRVINGLMPSYHGYTFQIV